MYANISSLQDVYHIYIPSSIIYSMYEYTSAIRHDRVFLLSKAIKHGKMGISELHQNIISHFKL